MKRIGFNIFTDEEYDSLMQMDVPSPNPPQALPSAKLYQPSITDELRVTEADGTYYYMDDVTLMLTEANKLEKLDPVKVRQYFENKPSPELPEGITDAQLMDTVKSRYCQSMSELKAYQEIILDDLKHYDNQLRMLEEESQQESENQSANETV